VFSPSANPSLSFPFSSGKPVEKQPIPTAVPNSLTELTRRLVAGDEAAFLEFHQRYFDRLFRFLLVLSQGQEQDAKEALQQTLLRVVRYIRIFDSEEVFWGWLKVVARSAARDGNRKQRRYSALLERFAFGFHSSTVAGDSNAEHRLCAILEESLAELAPQERQLLEAKYIEGATVREISQQTGLTEKAVESRLDRLRKSLRLDIVKRLRAL
jgi:RNA polymerase sigma-70 factor (ECF subfamily)